MFTGELGSKEMPQNEEGEFELVLGNRQLLSVFFIIVILMGVCLTMGYVLGRKAGSSEGGKAKSATIVVDPSQPESSPAASSALTPGDAQVQTPAPAAVPPPPEPVAAAPERATAPVAESKPPAAEAKPAVSAPPPAAPPAGAPEGVQEPAPGQTFLQVAAARPQDAGVLAEELRKKGFKTQLAPGPQGLLRVLVGPIQDSAERVKTRVRLKDEAGMDSFVKTYR